MKKALLVIDAQNAYTDPKEELYCENAEKTIENINKLIQSLKSTEIIYIKQSHKKDGSDLGRMYDFTEEEEEEFDFVENTPQVEFDKNLIVKSNSKIIIKTRYSAFQGTDLDQYLKGKGITKVIVAGFMTNFCCESTARDAHDKDYFVDFIVDATGTPGTDNLEQDEIRKIVSEFLVGGFSRVFNVEEYLSQD